MSELDWEQPGRHPPISLLLLHLDRELGRSEEAAIARHLAQCWECRAECDRLQRGIFGFIEYRSQVLLPALPPPPSAAGRLHQRLEGELAKPVSRFATRLRSLRAHLRRCLPWTLAAALATAATLLIAPKAFSSSLGGVPAMSSANFLELAPSAEVPKSDAAAYRKLEIRHGAGVYCEVAGRAGSSWPCGTHFEHGGA